MKLYALPHQDGCISIMQLADGDATAAIQKTVWSSPVIMHGVIEVTEEQAAAIRAARPQSPVQTSSNPVSQVNIAEIQVLEQRNQDLERQLEDQNIRLALVEQQFSMLITGLSESISKHKPEAAE